VTAGHCTFPEGTNGSPTPGNSGGNDVWVSFAEVPDYSILPPSSTFAPDQRRRRDRRRHLGQFSNNAATGGTCFGDSGGPIFVAGTNVITSVNSYAKNSTCSGTTGAYRIDQPDDLAFLATFGVTP
jgi:secreted trypsin-like serine protease